MPKSPENNDSPTTFTGIQRKRTTSKLVSITDFVARGLVTLGGIGTIISVATVFLFLFLVVLPLFETSEISNPASLDSTWNESTSAYLATDEYRLLGLTVNKSGNLTVFELKTGDVLYSLPLFDQKPTDISFHRKTNTFVGGFENGYFQYVTLTFNDEKLNKGDEGIPAELVDAEPGTSQKYILTNTDAGPDEIMRGKGVIYVTPIRQYGIQTLSLNRLKPKKVSSEPIQRIAHAFSGNMPYVVCSSGKENTPLAYRLIPSRTKTNFVTGKVEVTFSKSIELPKAANEVQLDYLVAFDAANNGGRQVFIISKDGKAIRYATPSFITDKKVVIAEEMALLDDEQTISSIGLALGQKTLLLGKTNGEIDRWHLAASVPSKFGISTLDHQGQRYVFKTNSPAHKIFLNQGVIKNPVIREKAYLSQIDLVSDQDDVIDLYLKNITIDNLKFFKASTFPALNATISGISSSYLSRIIAAVTEKGETALFYVPTAKLLTKSQTPELSSVDTIAMSPKNDGLIAISQSKLFNWTLDAKYPEAGFKAVFNKLIFENYQESQHIYQSTGSESSESKLSIMPLVFGTLKATFYTMIFAVPIALLAAIYTSEFLSPKWRSKIKPLVEMMASLPSVVLGFFAGLVFAQIVERELIGYVSCFITLPLTAAFAGQVWQCLPHSMAMKLSGYRFLLMFLLLPISAFLGLNVLGPILEATFYDGNFIAYLNGNNLIPQVGSPVGGWLIIFLPISFMFSALITHYIGATFFRALAEGKSRAAVTLLDLIRFLIWILIGGISCYAISFFTAQFIDSRSQTSIQLPVRLIFITPILTYLLHTLVSHFYNKLADHKSATLLKTVYWVLLLPACYFLSDFAYYGTSHYFSADTLMRLNYWQTLMVGISIWLLLRALTDKKHRPEKLGVASAAFILLFFLGQIILNLVIDFFAYIKFPINFSFLLNHQIEFNLLTGLSFIIILILGLKLFSSGDSDSWLKRKIILKEMVHGLLFAVIAMIGINLLHNGLDTVIDPSNEGAVFDTFIQRNALVVGFFMSFAVIPIIYTIAEDALSSVPAHLRAASLGAGATPWQTAVRIIIPTAASGLFSACMVGLGRAVGETMIVLMATGNTPIMEWNVFNGLRTLAANIAYEMPEAAVGSAHYRTLFLQALVLFAMTFIINTAAEYVRQQVRKRNMSL